MNSLHEAKEMREYNLETPPCGLQYERDFRMLSQTDCTVWVLHLHAHPSVIESMLECASMLPETTGEYTYGDSWTEWGEETEDDTNRHLAIYFNAEPELAKEVGDRIASRLTMAGVRALGGDPAHAVSTSGDYAEQAAESVISAHTYLVPHPALVRDGLDPMECGECGEVHANAKPGDTIPD